MKRNIYISGKISGLRKFEYRYNFILCEKEIKRLGLKPINPIRFKLNRIPHTPWLLHLIIDICILLTCEGIYMQRNWENSKGARIEYIIAKILNLTIIHQE